jgi:uncharacterized protein (TIGR03435 family)
MAVNNIASERRQADDLPQGTLRFGRFFWRRAKLHPNTGTPGHSTDWGKDHINAMDVTLAELADLLEVQLDRVVVNDTGIDGVFDFKLTWTPSQPTDLTGPSIFTAIQEQYGLKLEARKAPVEIIVIDHIERPTAN